MPLFFLQFSELALVPYAFRLSSRPFSIFKNVCFHQKKVSSRFIKYFSLSKQLTIMTKADFCLSSLYFRVGMCASLLLPPRHPAIQQCKSKGFVSLPPQTWAQDSSIAADLQILFHLQVRKDWKSWEISIESVGSLPFTSRLAKTNMVRPA